MAISSCGYAPLASSSDEEAFLLFSKNLERIKINAAKILETAEYFYCELPFAWCSWPYVGGDGSLPLGYLLLGWENGIFIEPCPDCKSDCYTFAFAGSPLSGSNNWAGSCDACKTRKGGRETVHKPFYNKLLFVASLRKNYQNEIDSWEEYEGKKFSFGGDELEPALCKRLKTTRLVRPVNLSQLISELEKQTHRPPNSSEHRNNADFMRLKFSTY